MRCKHCGSSCEDNLPNELTTDEAFELCNQLALLGLKYVNLSGGEPLLRMDWDKIAARLKSVGVQPHIISNGWFVDDAIAKRVYEAGIGIFAVSLDGLRDTHDYMRCKGSFDNVMKALRNLRANGVKTAVITTINRRNLPELMKMKDIIREQGVTTWQLQIATPMGSFHGHKEELLIASEQIDEIVDFAYKVKDEIKVCLGDCVGYYSRKEHEVRKVFFENENAVWNGCPAGKYSFGILHNGDITSCNSIRDTAFIEGNIRVKSLKEIWEYGFEWSRKMSREELTGLCQNCQYVDCCLGGCPNMRLCLSGTIKSENTYCMYHNMITSKFNELYAADISFGNFHHIIEKESENRNHVLIIKLIEAYLQDNKGLSKTQTLYLLSNLHYAYFQVKRYEKAKEVCERVLGIERGEAYALHGLAISHYYLGDSKSAFEILSILKHMELSKLKETIRDLFIAAQLACKEEDLKMLNSLATEYEIKM